MAKWSKARRANQEANKLNKLYSENAKNIVATASVSNGVQATASVDVERLSEYNYRRGLITAMECILRELR